MICRPETLIKMFQLRLRLLKSRNGYRLHKIAKRISKLICTLPPELKIVRTRSTYRFLISTRVFLKPMEVDPFLLKCSAQSFFLSLEALLIECRVHIAAPLTKFKIKTFKFAHELQMLTTIRTKWLDLIN